MWFLRRLQPEPARRGRMSCRELSSSSTALPDPSSSAPRKEGLRAHKPEGMGWSCVCEPRDTSLLGQSAKLQH